VATPGQRGAGWAFVDSGALNTFHQRTAGVSVWNGGEPNGGTGENAGEIYVNGHLNDIAQSNSRPYIIEWDANHLTNPTPWSVTDYKALGGNPLSASDHQPALDLINGVVGNAGTTKGKYWYINFADPEGGGGIQFVAQQAQLPFPGDTAANDEDFATMAKARIRIPSAGDYSFVVGRDDTYELNINGTSFIGTCCSDNSPVHTFTLPAGDLPITASFGERGGGAYFFLAGAPGNNVPFNNTVYHLVGDVQNGGLEVLPYNPNNWTVTEYKALPGNPLNASDHQPALDLINGVDGNAGTFTGKYPYINFADPESGGGTQFTAQQAQEAFPGNTPANDEDFAVLAEAYIQIPTAGDYSFVVGRDDTYQLTINGTTFTGTCCGDNSPIHTFTLPAGNLPISVSFGERGGGAYFFLAAAQGNNVTFDNTVYHLVGDVENGGLAIIPEPSTLMLAALGLRGLIGWGQRRRR